MSVRPPSRAYHRDILPQVDLGSFGIEHRCLTCGFPCLLFSMHTSFPAVGPKRQITVLRAS